MFAQNYLLALKFIRETEHDLEAYREHGLSALEEYERLIAELTEMEKEMETEKGARFSNARAPVKMGESSLSANSLSGQTKD